jgi:ribulose-phosphate 3-epimerase
MKNLQPEIYPSILTADLGFLANQIIEAEYYGVNGFHIDIMDGQFVPNITFGTAIVKTIRKFTALPLDIHLMVIKPERFFDELVSLGVDNISVHYEATDNLKELLLCLNKYDVKTSLAINPDTELSLITPYVETIDRLLIMSVHPGYGGQKFITTSLKKIRAAKELLLSTSKPKELQVDGGINHATIKDVTTSGANIVVAGSSIYNDKDDIGNSIKKLKSSLNQ